MSTRINGRFWHSGEENGVLVLGFADDKDQPSQYLLLQRTLAPSAQDRRLGQDGIHIEINDQSNSAYGGIRRVELKEDRIVLSLGESTARAIGSEENVEVVIDPAKNDDLRDELARLFAGQNVEIR